MQDLMAMKRPDAKSFSKKNTIRPFEDAKSFEFWAGKNDAGFFVYGQSTKKRPNGLVLARMFDGRVLDMCELGVDKYVGMDQFKVNCSSTITRGKDAKFDYFCCRHRNRHRVTSQ